jgi:glucosylglycerol 3-phosphatase
MGLVNDPLARTVELDYIHATQAFDPHFYVLTNGEHIGERGVNAIVERAAGGAETVREKGWYLPGLAAGGVQWQDRLGNVSHPGVSDRELDFLAAVPQRMTQQLQAFFARHTDALDAAGTDAGIRASVLTNVASPTANLNTLYNSLRDRVDLYRALQEDMQTLMADLLQDAQKQGLGDAFFVHYAPNLGRDASGLEILRPAQPGDSGTTDFQFMLRGAIKEAGVLALLNRYYFHRTGRYPLGEHFSVRQAPRHHDELLELVKAYFDPAIMPLTVGVGDTVTSQVEVNNGARQVRRGGSDRNFLRLVQDIGREFQSGNVVVYVDSSQGEVKNRKPVKLAGQSDSENGAGSESVLEGPCDPRDTDDPLTLNVVIPGGHRQYVELFCQAARARRLNS